MSYKVPLIPVYDPLGSFTWLEWFRQLRDILVNWVSTGAIQINTPGSGFSITVLNSTNNLVLTPAAALTSGTVILPATPIDGQIVTISTTKTITNLTVSPNSGQTLNDAPTTLTSTTIVSGSINNYSVTTNCASWIYYGLTSTWTRIG